MTDPVLRALAVAAQRVDPQPDREVYEPSAWEPRSPEDIARRAADRRRRPYAGDE
jgi:hypothetical protein